MKLPELLRLRKMSRRTIMLAVLVFLFVVSGGAMVLMRHNDQASATDKAIAKAAAQAANTPKKTTGIYFTDAKKLPKTYSPGKNLSLSFIIENQEGITLDYPYLVTFNGVKQAGHTINLKTNSTKIINELFTMPTDQQTINVEIKLINQNKSVQLSLARS